MSKHPQQINQKHYRKKEQTKRSILILLIFCSLTFKQIIAQCAISPAFPGCLPAGSSPLTDGASITTGTTRTVNGSFTFSNITLDGGTLIICGSLTLSNITINSGTIFVNTGGTLNCNGGTNAILGSGTNFYNNGTATFSGHFILNANATVINNGTLSTPFNYIIIQGLNSYIINNNQLTSGGFMAWIPSSPGCLCLGDLSSTTTNFFYNRTTNSVSVPTGYACLNVRQYASNDNIVTGDSELAVCVPTGISYSGIPNWGSAYLINNCTGCLMALPIELITFDGHIDNQKAVIEWSTASETNNCNFIVERATNPILFNAVGTQNGAVNSTTILNYQFIDNTISPNTIYYYRLKQVDCDGNFSYSNLISLSYSNSNLDLEFINSNVTNQSIEIINQDQIETINVYNTLGQLIYTTTNTFNIEFSTQTNGIFFIDIITKNGKYKYYKIFKNNY